MSVDYLLLAVRDHLRCAGPFTPHQCDITAEGEPHPDMGAFYVAVHDSSGVSNSQNDHLEEVFSIDVTITVRFKFLVGDRHAQALLVQNGIRDLESKVKRLLHCNHAVRILANTLGELPGINGDSFIEPLYFRRRGPRQKRDADWAGAAENQASFLVSTSTFDGGNRIQSFDVMR